MRLASKRAGNPFPGLLTSKVRAGKKPETCWETTLDTIRCSLISINATWEALDRTQKTLERCRELMQGRNAAHSEAAEYPAGTTPRAAHTSEP